MNLNDSIERESFLIEKINYFNNTIGTLRRLIILLFCSRMYNLYVIFVRSFFYTVEASKNQSPIFRDMHLVDRRPMIE